MKLRKVKGAVTAIILAIMVIVTYLVFAQGNDVKENNPSQQSYSVELPDYALGNPKVTEGYQFAVDNPDALNGVPCKCGCMVMTHDGRLHSRGLIDCFTKEDGSFEIHGSQCAQCVVDALRVKDLIAQGKSHDEIRQIISGK